MEPLRPLQVENDPELTDEEMERELDVLAAAVQGSSSEKQLILLVQSTSFQAIKSVNEYFRYQMTFKWTFHQLKHSEVVMKSN